MSQIGPAEATQPRCNEDGNGLIEGYAEPRGLDRLVVVLYAAKDQPDILIDQSPQTKEGEDDNPNDKILFNPSVGETRHPENTLERMRIPMMRYCSIHLPGKLATPRIPSVPPKMFNASIILIRIKGYIRLTMAK
jgi:hypothetical protein